MKLWLLALLSTTAFAQKTVDVHLGEWRASYSVFSTPDAVCDAEAQWLAEELHSVNVLLDGFLAKGTTRNGAWTENDLPLLEKAALTLPALVAAQHQTLTALPSCPLSKTGRFPELIARGVPLVKEAQSEVGRLPELVRFTRHRVVLERWERDRLERQLVARELCKPKETRIYFAWEDEFGARRWLFCDDSFVLAVPGRPWEQHTADGTPHDAKVATLAIQTARLFSEGELQRAPKL